MKNVNVVCVNWGTKYSTDYVERLFQMVKRNTTHEFKMYCLTDAPEMYSNDIIGIKLNPGYESWWNKMQLFRDDVLPAGEYLYFDLDVVIVDNIDCFFEYEGFGISRDFINPDKGLLDGREYNSSIMKFTQNKAIWRHFKVNEAQWKAAQAKIPFFGDQNVISDFLNKSGFESPFPDEWIWSFKIGSLRGRRPVDHSKFFGAEIPKGGKVCVFHGQPNPDQVNMEWVDKHWKGITPSVLHSNTTIKKNMVNKIDIRLEKSQNTSNIIINEQEFVVPNHWFWDEFVEAWELQTQRFFKANLIPGTNYLDIGAWVGPTALLATALGAAKLKIIEPNPVNFFNLLVTQFKNNLYSKWFLVNACVSSSRGEAIIGPLQGIASSSSATNIRDAHQEGAKVISLKLSDLISQDDNYSLVKIDIEGAEDYIVEDLAIFSKHNAATWLSIHPPFIQDVENFYERLIRLGELFYFVNEYNNRVEAKELKTWITTNEKFPPWGTKWGNFFEIGLLPKKYFEADGKRKA